MNHRRGTPTPRALGILAGLAALPLPARAQPPASTAERAAGDAILGPDTAGAGAVTAAAQAPVRTLRVGDGLPAAVSRAIGDVLSRPHLVVVAPPAGLTLGRAVRVDRPLVVVGGPLRLAAGVRGDVLAFGPVFLRPGADVDGRVVAVGGGVYPSALARVRRGTRAYRDVAFDPPREVPGGQLLLQPRVLARPAVARLLLPGTFGLRFPLYDRVNGLSAAVGPEVALDTGRVRIEPVLTYRSQLGVVDVGARAAAELTRRTGLELRAERGTFTNDAWARNDFVNAATFAAGGGDARNYYRADRIEALGTRRYDTRAGTLQPVAGLLVERSWSAARDSAASRPFTIVGGDDAREGARRPNPAVTGGRITSAILGGRLRRVSGRYDGYVEARVEQALAVERGGRFTRANIDVSLEQGERGERRASFYAHAAVTAGRDVPSQRYAYLGGGPTLPTLFLLSQGGTELVWGEARYTVPLPRLRVRPLSVAELTGRVAAGAAGVGTLAPLTPNVGLRLAVGPFRADAVADPSGRSRPPQLTLGFGVR